MISISTLGDIPSGYIDTSIPTFDSKPSADCIENPEALTWICKKKTNTKLIIGVGIGLLALLAVFGKR